MVDFFPNYFLIVGIIGLLGLGICIATIATFKLRLWKRDTYYFTTAVGLYTLHQFAAAAEAADVIGRLPVGVHMFLEIGFVSLIVFGVYKMKQTAETVGA